MTLFYKKYQKRAVFCQIKKIVRNYFHYFFSVLKFASIMLNFYFFVFFVFEFLFGLYLNALILFSIAKSVTPTSAKTA